ncbi:hypothetical protein [Litorilituus sediminis]|uniref:hypothetical protein n=1 Tax=Litorilituus sediminis TaxID=718192 RepID=UPI001B873782|nr:hypothetical protein [Litorilituus sediminis]
MNYDNSSLDEYAGFKLAHDSVYGYINIKPVGRGSVPKQLRSVYTNREFAKKAIDSYIAHCARCK